MFGRRNPDQPLDAPRQPPEESDLDLDMLGDLNMLPVEEPTPEKEPGAPPASEPRDEPNFAPDPAWHAATPSILGPSVTRLLQEAEAANQRQSAAVTQQLTPIEPEVAQPVVAPSLNGEALAPAARARAIAESVIGPDDFFDGRYRSERGVRIQGNARGSIESRQYIFVEAGAQVEADLSAEDITVSGDFRGKISCRRRLEVTSSGKIFGQVQTALLVVQEGGAIDGELPRRAGEAEPGQE
jgi:cytoskeletal protein CcmA (bactofilin family)